jgi:cyclopropane-fatty-acyl-phospholipid synthase
MDTTSQKKLDRPSGATESTRLSWMERLFAHLLCGLRGGSMRLSFPSGATVVVGEPEAAGTSSFSRSPELDAAGAVGEPGVPVELSILDKRFFRKVFAGGSVGLGEAYVAGYWTTRNLTGLLLLLAQNQQDMGRLRQGFSWLSQKMNRVYHLTRRNTVEKSRENIQEHYDLSNDFYATFLDASMTYSSAYFSSLEQSLEAAQWAKIDRMLDLAAVQAGDSILEIGSGWGALAERAALRGCRVKTITLSEEQFAYAKARFEAAGLTAQVEIVLQDYRHVEGQFDAVISCEMIEAVGREYLESYFQVIRDRLKPAGKAVIQSITIPDARYAAYSRGCDWIQKYIFPGGHLPSPGTIRSCAEQAGGMRVVQIDGFGRDYAETLRRWALQFNAAHTQIAEFGFDANFCRKWNYYLSYCEAGFLADLIDVKHVVLQREA